MDSSTLLSQSVRNRLRDLDAESEFTHPILYLLAEYFIVTRAVIGSGRVSSSHGELVHDPNLT